VIIRIAILNRIDYVIQQHVPALALADGVSLKECEALRDWRASDFFSERERAVLAYTDAMTRDVAVPDAVFTAVRGHFNERELVELTVLIGTYNMHNRVMLGLGIDLEAQTP
jgi:alkylhydroperoxidase family enzyme